MPLRSYAAVDLGATSGRVVRATVGGDRIDLQEIHRFRHEPQPHGSNELRWDYDALLAETLHGLRAALEVGPIDSLAIDTWGVDYGLLDGEGSLLAGVQAYRSPRHHGVMDSLTAELGRDYIYGITGIQFLPFNTLYQLVADSSTEAYQRAALLLMLPDLLNNALVGTTSTDVTNASTSQLLDARTRTWSEELAKAAGLRTDLLPPIHEPGSLLGTIGNLPGLTGIPVIAAASHDTASAIAGIPMADPRRAAYISSGTWSLVGMEVTEPITSAEALAANVTNELGIGGTVRLLKNVTGMWLLEECRREWQHHGNMLALPELIQAAKAVPGGRAVVNPDDSRFAAPGPMVARIAQSLEETGQPVPTTQPEIARVIFDSLALAYRRVVAQVERVAGRTAEVIHVVGGGAANTLLNQLTADATGRPVLAGPTEATVLGNVITQAMADGTVADLAAGRRLISSSIAPARFEPHSHLDWDAMEQRIAATA